MVYGTQRYGASKNPAQFLPARFDLLVPSEIHASYPLGYERAVFGAIFSDHFCLTT